MSSNIERAKRIIDARRESAEREAEQKRISNSSLKNAK